MSNNNLTWEKVLDNINYAPKHESFHKQLSEKYKPIYVDLFVNLACSFYEKFPSDYNEDNITNFILFFIGIKESDDLVDTSQIDKKFSLRTLVTNIYNNNPKNLGEWCISYVSHNIKNTEIHQAFIEQSILLAQEEIHNTYLESADECLENRKLLWALSLEQLAILTGHLDKNHISRKSCCLLGEAISIVDDIIDYETDIKEGNKTALTAKDSYSSAELFTESQNCLFELEKLIKDPVLFQNAEQCYNLWADRIPNEIISTN